MILSCARLYAVKPMRFAGTWSRYSNRATPQETSAAMNQGFAESSFRWAYHAKVMKTFERASSPMVWRRTVVLIDSSRFFYFLILARGEHRSRLSLARDPDLRR